MLCVLLGGILVLAAWARLRNIGSSTVLQDSIGPFWAALRGDGRTHAPGYGVGLLAPYWIMLVTAASLWGAVCGLAWIHAVVAVVGAFITRLRLHSSLFAAGVVGAILALDNGLVGSVLSGAEGYFAPLWIGVAVATSGALSWIAYAMAVANHPLAICGLPLMFRNGGFRRSDRLGVAIAVAMIAHQASGLGGGGVPEHDVLSAWAGAFRESPAGTVAMVVGPLAGLWAPQTRRLAVGVMASVSLLCLAGSHLDYLRDHHLRIFIVPAIACWAAAPRLGCFIALAATVAFPIAHRPPEVELRAGTLSLNSALSDKVSSLPTPLVVDRAWLSGGPGAEPAGVMLDLVLRGWDEEQLNTSGGALIIVAADEEDIGQVGLPGTVIVEGHGFAAVYATQPAIRTWSESVCQRTPKLGGAWDALSVLQPELTVNEVRDWWACRSARGSTL